MRVLVYKNKGKVKEDDPDYLVIQKQRNEDETAYVMVQIGVGWKQEMPDGEQYIDIKFDTIKTKK